MKKSLKIKKMEVVKNKVSKPKTANNNANR